MALAGQRISTLFWCWQAPGVKGIFPSGEVPIPEGSQAETYNYPGGTVLPGLIDCHTHTNMPGDGRTGEDVDNDGDDVRLSRGTSQRLEGPRDGRYQPLR